MLLKKERTINVYGPFFIMNTLKDTNDMNDSEAPPISFQQNAGSIYRIYFYNQIVEPHKYIKIINDIKSLGAWDEIHLHFSCYGGSLDTTFAILSALQMTAAKKIAFLDSNACSAAALLFLTADNWVVPAQSYLMFHTFTAGYFGKSPEIDANFNFATSFYKTQFQKIFVPFMTEEEFRLMMDGKDYWFGSDEVLKRLQVLADHRQKEAQKYQEELKQAEIPAVPAELVQKEKGKIKIKAKKKKVDA